MITSHFSLIPPYSSRYARRSNRYLPHPSLPRYRRSSLPASPHSSEVCWQGKLCRRSPLLVSPRLVGRAGSRGRQAIQLNKEIIHVFTYHGTFYIFSRYHMDKDHCDPLFSLHEQVAIFQLSVLGVVVLHHRIR